MYICLFRASSRGWIWMRSCMWAVTLTTHCSPKLLALRLVLSVRHLSVYTSREGKSEILTWCHYCAGCIRQLVIQGDEVIFKDLDRSSTGVTNCPTCKDHPCQVSHFLPVEVFAMVGELFLLIHYIHVGVQNGGACEDSETSLYKCTCTRGFIGSNCQHHSSLHCHSGTASNCLTDRYELCHYGSWTEQCWTCFW